MKDGTKYIEDFFNNNLSEDELVHFKKRLETDEAFAKEFKEYGSVLLKLKAYRRTQWSKNKGGRGSKYVLFFSLLALLVAFFYWTQLERPDSPSLPDEDKNEQGIIEEDNRSISVDIDTIENQLDVKDSSLSPNKGKRNKQKSISPLKNAPKKTNGDKRTDIVLTPPKLKDTSIQDSTLYAFLNIIDGSYSKIPTKDMLIEKKLNLMADGEIKLSSPSRDTIFPLNFSQIEYVWEGQLQEALFLKIYTSKSILNGKYLEYDLTSSPFIFDEKLNPDLYYWDISPREKIPLYTGKFKIEK